jgi:hypothetical protein
MRSGFEWRMNNKIWIGIFYVLGLTVDLKSGHVTHAVQMVSLE